MTADEFDQERDRLIEAMRVADEALNATPEAAARPEAGAAFDSIVRDYEQRAGSARRARVVIDNDWRVEVDLSGESTNAQLMLRDSGEAAPYRLLADIRNGETRLFISLDTSSVKNIRDALDDWLSGRA